MSAQRSTGSRLAVSMQEQYGKLGGYASKYPYLVGIRTESNNWGTGILISPLHVLTCAHVLDDETEPVEVISQEGRTSARPQKRENPPDLALLKLERPLLIPQATFTNSALQPSGFAGGRRSGHAWAAERFAGCRDQTNLPKSK